MGVNTGVKHRELNAIKRLDFRSKSVVSRFGHIVALVDAARPTLKLHPRQPLLPQ